VQAGEDLYVTASVDYVVVHLHVLFPLHGILISADETKKSNSKLSLHHVKIMFNLFLNPSRNFRCHFAVTVKFISSEIHSKRRFCRPRSMKVKFTKLFTVEFA
jgi:hypothetical protein